MWKKIRVLHQKSNCVFVYVFECVQMQALVILCYLHFYKMGHHKLSIIIIIHGQEWMPFNGAQQEWVDLRS